MTEQKLLVERVEQLVQERIAPRAAQYDLALEAPGEDMQDLHREGWLLANLERKRGGLGYGLNGDDPLAFFLLDEHLAHGNPSTAHCFQVHNNTLMNAFTRRVPRGSTTSGFLHRRLRPN